MPDYRIRTAGSNDLDYVHRAALALDRLERNPDSEFALKTRRDFPDMLQVWLTNLLADPQALALIAENCEGVSVGFILGFVQPQTNPFTVYAQHAIIQLVWVENDFRRHGIAGLLVETMETCFRELGIPYCEIQYTTQNPAAEGFWSARGYRQDHVTCRKFLDH